MSKLKENIVVAVISLTGAVIIISLCNILGITLTM
jgi:hypothetical protein